MSSLYQSSRNQLTVNWLAYRPLSTLQAPESYHLLASTNRGLNEPGGRWRARVDWVSFTLECLSRWVRWNSVKLLISRSACTFLFWLTFNSFIDDTLYVGSYAINTKQDAFTWLTPHKRALSQIEPKTHLQSGCRSRLIENQTHFANFDSLIVFISIAE